MLLLDNRSSLFFTIFCQVMVSEYVHGKNHPNHPEEYVEYVKDRGYQLLTIDDYVKVESLIKCLFSLQTLQAK